MNYEKKFLVHHSSYLAHTLTRYLFFIITSVFSQSIFAQTKIDSLGVGLAVDSIQKILQTDSLKKKKPKTPPQIAFQRSLILPGAGQIYNRQKWLVPFIYAGAGASACFLVQFDQKYHQYKSAYIEAAITQKAVVVAGKGPYSATQLAFAKNGYRRYRDLNYIGLALGWTLQAVQANVQAHLGTFDNNNDISLKFKPYFDGYTGGVSLIMGLENKTQRHKGTKENRYSMFDVGK